MYANSYAISKTNNLDFYIDPLVDITKKNIILLFILNNFNINSKIAPINLFLILNIKIFKKNIDIF